MSETPMKKLALLIGINEYQVLPTLKYARQDAEAVADSLKQNYNFSDNEIVLLTENKPGIFKPLNRRVIQKQLSSLANQEYDLFIFGFWGHGLLCNGKRFLCPLDVMMEDVIEMGMPFDELKDHLANIKAKNTCIILDCCQTVHDQRGVLGSESEALTVDEQMIFENIPRDISFKREKLSPEFRSNVSFLISCKEGQCAYEWDERGHGIFTAHLLDALSHRCSNVAQLVERISENVENTAKQLGKIQTPFFKLEGNILLPANSVDAKPEDSKPKPADSDGTQPKYGDVFISYRHCNADLVAPVEAELQRRGISYFIDRIGISLSTNYSTVIARAIKACKVLLIVWTRESNTSHDMLQEVVSAQQLHKNVLPYKVGKFNVTEHDALFLQLSPLSRCEVDEQTPESVTELVNQIQSMLGSHPSIPSSPFSSSVKKSKTKNKFLLVLSLIAVGLIVLFGTLGFRGAFSKQNNVVTPQSILEQTKIRAYNGDYYAQYLLGTYYYFGNGVEKNIAEAIKWFRMSAAQGYAPAQYFLGYCLFNEQGYQDKAEAVKRFLLAAKQDHVQAQMMLAMCYDKGEGVVRNIEEATYWFRKAANNGFVDAQHELGRRLEFGIGVDKNPEKAVEWYRKAADRGHVMAQCNLAQCLLRGNGVEQNKSEAILYLKKAATNGYARAQYYWGLCYYIGEGVPADPEEAKKWFHEAYNYYSNMAIKHDPESLFMLAQCYDNGFGVSQDKKEAIKWYGESAEQGYRQAQFELGRRYAFGIDVAKDKEKAVEWLSKAAEQGHPVAQHLYGLDLLTGDGIAQDKAAAVEWIRKSAEQGLVQAQFTLGKIYFWGNDVIAKDPEEAKKWFHETFVQYNKLAEQGNPESQFMLGVCYLSGFGVEKNTLTAIEWYRKAANNGYLQAQYNLGLALFYGNGVDQDKEEAKKWFHEAFVQYSKLAETGYPDSQFMLGVCYYNGFGIEKNKAEAVKWYRKAAEQDYSLAQYNLGIDFLYGKGITQDSKEAVNWFSKAAEKDCASAQYMLGVCCQYGIGVEKDADKASEWYGKAVKQFQEETEATLDYSQRFLGLCYYTGRGVERDFAKAVELYQKSAEQNFPIAYYSLGFCYRYGLGVEKDAAKAEEMFAKAVERDVDNEEVTEDCRKMTEFGDAVSQFELGLRYTDGFGVEKDLAEAVKWLRKSADQGFEPAVEKLKEMGEWNDN